MWASVLVCGISTPQVAANTSSCSSSCPRPPSNGTLPPTGQVLTATTVHELGNSALYRNIGTLPFAHLVDKQTAVVEPCVPMKIHFIWLTCTIPRSLLATVAHVGSQNRPGGFKTMLWVDHPLPSEVVQPPFVQVRNVLQYEWYNANWISSKTNPGAKSDMLRLEIVHREGGIYLDTDIIPHMPLDVIRGLGYFHAPFLFHSPYYGDVGNFAFGFGRGSPFLEIAIRLVNENLRRAPATKSVVKIAGGTVLSSALLLTKRLTNTSCVDLLVEAASASACRSAPLGCRRCPLAAPGRFPLAHSLLPAMVTSCHC